MNRKHEEFLAGLPKAELHLHAEGTLRPAQKWRFAKRNRIALSYDSEAAIEAAQAFEAPDAPTYLRKFLAFYFEGLDVLRTELDFRDLAYEHLATCGRDGVRYVELSFDPQAHTSRGLSFGMVVEGLHAGLREGERQFGVQSQLIMSINRDRSAESAWQMLDEAAPFRHLIAGLGLDSVEEGNPPIKFAAAYGRARADGYRLTAHCDVDQKDSVLHLWQCIDVLKVERIDHGLNCLEDERLLDALRSRDICLTACPTWRPFDPAPRRVERIRSLFDQNICVTVNSDDPGLFSSGTLGALLPAVAAEGGFTKSELAALMRHAFHGSWLAADARRGWLAELDAYLAADAAHAIAPPPVT